MWEVGRYECQNDGLDELVTMKWQGGNCSEGRREGRRQGVREGGREGEVYVLDVLVGAFIVGRLDLLVVLDRPLFLALAEEFLVVLGRK